MTGRIRRKPLGIVVLSGANVAVVGVHVDVLLYINSDNISIDVFDHC